MAKIVSEEEIQLRKRARRRVVGAITLVIAAVVILPMVLDSKPEQRSHEIDIRIPSEDSVEELGAESASSTKATNATVPPVSRAEAEAQQDVAASGKNMPSAQSGEEPASIDETAGTNTAPAAPTEEFVVQLGAFSTQAKAKQQSQKLASKNFAAYTETVKSGKEEITRVRVGPFGTREEAERTREKLKKVGFEGVVTEK